MRPHQFLLGKASASITGDTRIAQPSQIKSRQLTKKKPQKTNKTPTKIQQQQREQPPPPPSPRPSETPVAAPQDVWRYRVSATTGWPGRCQYSVTEGRQAGGSASSVSASKDAESSQLIRPWDILCMLAGRLVDLVVRASASRV